MNVIAEKMFRYWSIRLVGKLIHSHKRVLTQKATKQATMMNKVSTATTCWRQDSLLLIILKIKLRFKFLQQLSLLQRKHTSQLTIISIEKDRNPKVLLAQKSRKMIHLPPKQLFSTNWSHRNFQNNKVKLFQCKIKPLCRHIQIVWVPSLMSVIMSRWKINSERLSDEETSQSSITLFQVAQHLDIALLGMILFQIQVREQFDIQIVAMLIVQRPNSMLFLQDILRVRQNLSITILLQLRRNYKIQKEIDNVTSNKPEPKMDSWSSKTMFKICTMENQESRWTD